MQVISDKGFWLATDKSGMQIKASAGEHVLNVLTSVSCLAINESAATEISWRATKY